MSNADWFYITVSSSDDTTIPGDTAYAFTNSFPVPLNMNGNRIQAALYDVSYDTSAITTNYTVFCNSSLVQGLQMVGSNMTNTLRRITLPPGKLTFTPLHLQWVEAVTDGGSVSIIQTEFTITTADTGATDMKGVTFVTYVFRVIE